MPSFDIVSKVNMQEVDNAFQQAKKEIDQRYDFKGTDTAIERVQTEKENGIKLRSSTEPRLEAAREIVLQKIAKRGISLRSVKYGAVEQSGKLQLQTLTFVQGLEVEKAKALVKLVKDSKIKVQGAIQGDTVRVSGKNRDDLQAAMQLVRANADGLDVDVGFENFRD
jgi:cyclic-di-GMP-binding protein